MTFEELKQIAPVSEKALLQNLHRLKSKGQLAQVRRGFYLIIPPQYVHQGMLPAVHFLNDMMHYLKRDYYLGLFSAAALHGAGHQQVMESQIFIHKPALRTIKKKNLVINFFTRTPWKPTGIVEKKTPSGFVIVSSVEQTAIDLIMYHHKTGGLGRVYPVLEELAEVMKVSKLIKLATEIPAPAIQRLGYILDHLGEQKLSIALAKLLAEKNTKPALLSLSDNSQSGPKIEKWNLKLNTELDSL